MNNPILSVRDLRKHFPIQRGVLARTVGHVRAVDGVSFDLAAGETLGLVGESGCGKTTLGRCLLRLIEPTSGEIYYDGQDFLQLSSRKLTALRRQMQMVFQDPFSSLNPRLSIATALTEPILVHGLADSAEAARDKAIALLTKVGLDEQQLDLYPHQFSGGQRQRIGIARALAVEPRLLICDEPVSALDVSVQAQVLNLLADLREEFGLSTIFIAHDLAVVAHFCNRVAVMYLGEIVELAPVDTLYQQPLHPYTQALLSAIPPDFPGQQRKRIVLAGDPPSPLEPSSAKRFTQRFPDHAAAFLEGEIELREVNPGHWVRCARPEILQEMADSVSFAG